MTRALLLLAVVMAGCEVKMRTHHTSASGLGLHCERRTVDGLPCLVCMGNPHSYDSVAISCDWSRDGGGR